MPELTLVFGPNNSFFFDCPKAWKFHNIPPTLRQLFTSAMSPEWRIAQPYCLALGPPCNSPEPIWYVGCKVLEGQDKIFYSQTYFDTNYPDLARWTKSIPNASRSAFITFGSAPYSYFACAPGHGSVWAGVPSELTDKVQKAFDIPSCVSLGVNDSWFVLWPDGYCAWKFNKAYGDLDRILNEAAPRTVSYLAISPYNPNHYFIAFKDRTIKYNFVGAPEWMAQMQEVFNGWQAEIVQRQGYQQPYYPPIMNGMPGMPGMPVMGGMPVMQGMPAPPPPHLSQYAPNYTPGAPVYIAAHYANAHPPPPQFSPYSPNGGGPPGPAPVELMAELPGNLTFAPQSPPPAKSQPQSPAPMSPPPQQQQQQQQFLQAPPQQSPAQRPASILTQKKKGFFSKVFSK